MDLKEKDGEFSQPDNTLAEQDDQDRVYRGSGRTQQVCSTLKNWERLEIDYGRESQSLFTALESTES